MFAPFSYSVTVALSSTVFFAVKMYPSIVCKHSFVSLIVSEGGLMSFFTISTSSISLEIESNSFEITFS